MGRLQCPNLLISASEWKTYTSESKMARNIITIPPLVAKNAALLSVTMNESTKYVRNVVWYVAEIL